MLHYIIECSIGNEVWRCVSVESPFVSIMMTLENAFCDFQLIIKNSRSFSTFGLGFGFDIFAFSKTLYNYMKVAV